MTATPDVNRATDWHILGAGAMGSLWACKLIEAGHRVTLLCHSDEQLQRFQQDPHLYLQAFGENQQQSLPIHYEPTNAATTISNLLITTKSYDTEPAVTTIQQRISADTQLLIMQNGMGSQQWLAERCPDSPVFAATTTEGAYRTGKQHLVHAGLGETFIGAFNAKAQQQGHHSSAMQSLLALKTNIQYVDDIQTRLWQKLAINCAINPLTAIHNCQNGELSDNPAYQNEMAELCFEIENLTEVLNITLFEEPLFVVAQRVARATAANISSMLQDVRQHRRTEIDFINGYLCRLAADEDMEEMVGLNQELVEKVTALEPAIDERKPLV